MGLEPFRLLLLAPLPLLLLGEMGMLDAESERGMCEGDSGMVGREWNDALPCPWAFIVRRLGSLEIGRGWRKELVGLKDGRFSAEARACFVDFFLLTGWAVGVVVVREEEEQEEWRGEAIEASCFRRVRTCSHPNVSEMEFVGQPLLKGDEWELSLRAGPTD